MVENPEAKRIDMEYVSLEDLLKKSDIISINCPLNDQTRYLINQQQFALMKPGVFIINTARGGVINTKALIDALESERLGGVCLDVYENEKGLFFHDHRKSVSRDKLFSRLRSFENVLITGHQAFLTQEALEEIAKTTVNNITDWIQNGGSANDLD